MSIEGIPDDARERVRRAVALLLRRNEKLTIAAAQKISGVNRKRAGDLVRAHKAGLLPDPGAEKSGEGAWNAGGASAALAGEAPSSPGGDPLPGLDAAALAAELTSAKTLGQLGAVSRRVGAALAARQINASTANAIEKQISRQQQIISAALKSPKVDPERVYLTSEDGALLVDIFERICSEERRADVLRYAGEKLEVDIATLPNVDPVGQL